MPYHWSIDPVLCVSSLRHFQFSVSSQAVHKPFLWRSYSASLHLKCCHKSTVWQRKESKHISDDGHFKIIWYLRFGRTHYKNVTNNVFLSWNFSSIYSWKNTMSDMLSDWDMRDIFESCCVLPWILRWDVLLGLSNSHPIPDHNVQLRVTTLFY